jgi:DNA polymerase III epsilon subunit-like protein
VANWYHRAAEFLGGIPGDYIAFDTETQGKDPESPSTLPVQLGYAVVSGGKLVDHGDYLLNWTLGPHAVPEGQFATSLIETASRMAELGKPYHTTWDLIRDGGIEPGEALALFSDLLTSAVSSGMSLVAHNGYTYDRVMLEHCTRRRGIPLSIDPERLVDTGLLEKCFQMGWEPPQPGSCRRREWYNKIAEANSFVRWSLDRACSERYGLPARHGLSVDLAHSAGYDSVVCHHLLEAMRERAGEGPDADHWLDLSQTKFTIGPNSGLKGLTLGEIAQDRKKLASLEWFSRQEWFQVKFGDLAGRVGAFLATL